MVVHSLTLFVVVYSLYMLNVYCSWYEILTFAVLFVQNGGEIYELVDRQIPLNVVIVFVESLPFAAWRLSWSLPST